MKINRTEPLYQKIANKLISMIPVDWMNIYLYAEVCKKSTRIHFFFEPTNETDKFIYYQDIPSKFKVLKGEFNHKILELHKLVFGLHGGYSNYTDRKWSTISVTVRRTGDFLIDYDLQEFVELSLEDRKIAWIRQNIDTHIDDKIYRLFFNKDITENR